jgi:hypothetical protein
MRRWRILATLLVAVPLAALVLSGVAFRLYPRAVLERAGTWATGRATHVVSARFSGAATLELVDLSIEAAEGEGSRELMRISRLVADIVPAALLHGELRLGRLEIDGLRVVLRRNSAGVANWKRPIGQDQPLPPSRPWLPTILAMRLRDSGLTLRTTSGAELRIEGRDVGLRTGGQDQAVNLDGQFAYNDAPIELTARLGSFDDYRDETRRYPMNLAAKSGDSRVALDGSADRPLDFDAVEGRLEFTTEDVGGFVAIFGKDPGLKVAAELRAVLNHIGNGWRLSDVQGVLAGGAFTGELALNEGARGSPDDLRTTLNFADFDLDTLLRRHVPPADAAEARLVANAEPGTLLDANISIERLGWHGAGITGLHLRPRITPGRIALDDISFAAAGGRVTGAASAEGAGPGIAANFDIAGADAASLLRLAGMRTTLLSGRTNGYARANATGSTAAQAGSSAVGQIVLAMGQGQISREIMSLASTDILRLFGPASGFTRISCLLAVLDVREGFGVLTPFRVRSGEGTLFGGGVIDLGRNSLDLTIKTEGSSTGFFSIDLPVHITGPMADPTIRPQIDSDAVAIARQGVVAASRLPEPLRALAQGNACLR